MKPLPKVKCPTCKNVGDWFAGSYGPFCSHPCKLIDLGKWFNQEHCISEPLPLDAGLTDAPGPTARTRAAAPEAGALPAHRDKIADLPSGEHLDGPDTVEKT